MELKVMHGVRLNKNQLQEVVNLVMSQPDMGWNYNEDTGVQDNVMNVVTSADYGTYTYRVNLSWNLITLLSVE